MAQLCLPIRQLVEFLLRTGSIDSRFTGFDRANEGARLHRKLQKAAGESYEAEVFLSAERTVEDITFTIEGRADGIFTENGLVTIDEIKTTAIPTDEITEDMNLCHWAQGMLYAAIYGQQNGLERLAVRLTYYQIDTDEIVRFTRKFSIDELEAFFLDLLRQYLPWARRQLDWNTRRNQSLRELKFPFATYRPGQRALAGEIYRACAAGKTSDRKGGTRLFCQAPTGIGKTMSAIFPALKAIGEGKGEKLFYLTARNTTQTAAEDAVARLRSASPELSLRSVTLTAKEKACLCKDEEGHPSCLPEACPYANGYYERIKDALAALLDGDGSFSRSTLTEAAKRFKVCPFEMGLDLSEWCDVVIGDYNYLFDPVVHLRRFFDGAGDWLFLVDEAHNLPDRARAMYSASFRKSSLTEAKRALGRGKGSLKTALTKADKAFLEVRKTVAKLAPRHQPVTAQEESITEQTSLLDTPETSVTLPEPIFAENGTVFLKELPDILRKPLGAVQVPLQAWLEDNPDDPAHGQLLELYFAVQDMTRSAERYDEHFVTQLTAYGSDLELSILCLDPSPFVDASLACGRAAAMFSATLTPPGYYKNVLGCPDARAVALESPFPAEHIGLYCLPVSTRYRNREKSVSAISDALAVLANGKVGNYLAFFPSYAYMKQVWEDFSARYPDIETLVQESGLDDAGRAAFLEKFAPNPEKTLLGFGVMGGIFGEGVDLVGDRLIGCAVVGVGLPQVNPRQEILKRYYDELSGTGFEYAYRYPGMNKVLQAAGRVIRTQEDKGVVLLLDDRFARNEYARLLPKHWAHLRYLRTAKELEEQLNRFWKQFL